MSAVAVVGAVLIVAGVVVMLASGPALLVIDHIVRTCSKSVAGTLVGQKEHKRLLSRMRSYSPIVRYEINDLPYEREASYVDGMGTAQKLEPGTSVTVWYRPSKPTKCYVVGSGPLAKRQLLARSYWIAAGVTALGAVIFLFAG